ncbi:hypothetical protein XELAEV_18004516mg [Xenopus laevis]|uniref:Uncharacterized protein n=1 Tax=Xenopus laevis TaxID=8355 RepID=A0A974GZN0_XENLA|nr:hypothetical protein XELAEV_18004516mg [Xenopus laevis]
MKLSSANDIALLHTRIAAICENCSVLVWSSAERWPEKNIHRKGSSRGRADYYYFKFKNSKAGHTHECQ